MTLRSFGVGKKAFEDNVSNEADYMLGEVARLREKAFDPTSLISNAISNVTCDVIFGQRFDYNDPTFKFLLDSMSQLLKLSGPGGLNIVLPILKYFQRSLFKRVKQNIENTRGYVKTAIAEHQEGYDKENPRDYIDVYLNEMEENSNLKSFINHDNLTQTIGDLFLAGTETTSTTMLWAILFMMAYPDVQKRVQEELDSVVGRNRQPKLGDKPALPFTCATLMEVQRIATILPLGVVHYSGDDTTIAGYNVPKGCLVVSNLWSIHHDPEVWDKPDEFNPERFLDKDGVVQERDELIPFSIGMFVVVVVCLFFRLNKSINLRKLLTGLAYKIRIKKTSST